MSDDPWNEPSFGDETLPVLRPRDAMRRPLPSIIDVAGRSETGHVRAQNEDSFVIADLGRWLELRDTSLTVGGAQRRIAGPQGTLLVVADGMGGHGGGEVASAVAVDAIAQFALYAMPWVTRPDDADEEAFLATLGESFSQCQARLERVALRKQLEHHRMGTTLTVAYVLWPKVYVVHAGDSRCYLQRDGALVQITRDHTMGQALRDSGAIGEGPSNYDHVLVNVVGGGSGEVAAEAHCMRLERGDQLLLCSDGLTGHVADPGLAAALTESASAAEACERLVRNALDDGGQDNITVVVARL